MASSTIFKVLVLSLTRLQYKYSQCLSLSYIYSPISVDFNSKTLTVYSYLLTLKQSLKWAILHLRTARIMQVRFRGITFSVTTGFSKSISCYDLLLIRA